MSIFDEMEKDSATFKRAPTPEESQNLTTLGLELVEIDQRLEKWALLAKELMARKNELQMKVLVDAMDAVGQDVIGLGEQGVDLKLDDYFKAGLPNPDADPKITDEERARLAELRAAGIAFLSEDAPDILTTTVTVTLPKGSLEQAREIVGMLTSEQGFGLEPSRVKLEEGAHWATLTSYVKEQIRERKRSDLPLEALGATVGRIVKIVKRKKK